MRTACSATMHPVLVPERLRSDTRSRRSISLRNCKSNGSRGRRAASLSARQDRPEAFRECAGQLGARAAGWEGHCRAVKAATRSSRDRMVNRSSRGAVAFFTDRFSRRGRRSPAKPSADTPGRPQSRRSFSSYLFDCGALFKGALGCSGDEIGHLTKTAVAIGAHVPSL
jgi:hypothetical protein